MRPAGERLAQEATRSDDLCDAATRGCNKGERRNQPRCGVGAKERPRGDAALAASRATTWVSL
jgi:hypothetical protein